MDVKCYQELYYESFANVLWYKSVRNTFKLLVY